MLPAPRLLRDRVAGVGFRDDNHVGETKGRRVVRTAVEVLTSIARRGDEHHPRVPEGRDRLPQGRVVAAASPRRVDGDEVCFLVGVFGLSEMPEIGETLDGVARGPLARARDELADDELSFPHHPGDEHVVVPDRTDHAGDTGTVSIVVHRITGRYRARSDLHGGESVQPVYIVDVAVTVVIDPISRYLAWIRPDVRL